MDTDMGHHTVPGHRHHPSISTNQPCFSSSATAAWTFFLARELNSRSLMYPSFLLVSQVCMYVHGVSVEKERRTHVPIIHLSTCTHVRAHLPSSTLVTWYLTGSATASNCRGSTSVLSWGGFIFGDCVCERDYAWMERDGTGTSSTIQKRPTTTPPQSNTP